MKRRIVLCAFFLSLFFLSSPGTVLGQFPQSLERSNMKINYELDTLTPLNTSYSEFSPVVHKDRILFTSNRQSDLLNRNMESWSRNSYLSLFWVDLGALFDSVAFRNVEKLSNKINIQNHTGPLVFGPDHETAIFTRVGKKVKGSDGKEMRRPSLFKARYEDGDWKDIQRLSFSDPAYKHAHPALLGKERDRLIFASDREGGVGKTDLFISRKKNGTWAEPESLPDSLNSPAKEVFPYCTDSALFFASDRSGGFGGLDIYCSLLQDDGSWGKLHHLKKPLNSSSDDFGLYLRKNREDGYFSSDRRGGVGSDDIYGLKVIEKVVVEKSALSGRFKYRKLDGEYPEGRTVELVDDEGNVVMRTKTDSNGRFSFKELPGEKDVKVRLKDADADVELVMTGKKEGVSLMKDDQGRFVYRKLEGDQVGTKRLIELSDPEMDSAVPDLSGQFVYERLPSQKAGERTVQLIDDEGNVVRQKKTDGRGNFKFQELPGDKERRLRLKEVPEEDLKLLVYNGKGKVVAQLKSGENGVFDYRKLSGDKSGGKLLDTEEPEMAQRSKDAMYGKFEYKKLDGEVPSGMRIKVLNDEGKVQFVSKADSAGYFRFVNLELRDSMVFDVQSSKEPEGEMVVKIMDRYGDVVAVLHKNKKGFFVYRKLKGDTAEQRLKKNQDDAQLAMKEDKEEVDSTEQKKPEEDEEPVDKGSQKLTKLLFEKESSYLSEKTERSLKRIAEDLKGNERKILIEGHASSDGPEDFNNWLSERRAKRVRKHLIEKGVDPGRIQVEWYGEDRLLNDCDDPNDCSEEKHARNRRVELSYR